MHRSIASFLMTIVVWLPAIPVAAQAERKPPQRMVKVGPETVIADADIAVHCMDYPRRIPDSQDQFQVVLGNAEVVMSTSDGTKRATSFKAAIENMQLSIRGSADYNYLVVTVVPKSPPSLQYTITFGEMVLFVADQGSLDDVARWRAAAITALDAHNRAVAHKDAKVYNALRQFRQFMQSWIWRATEANLDPSNWLDRFQDDLRKALMPE